MKENTNLIMVLINIVAFFLSFCCLLLIGGTNVLSAEPVQLPSLGVNPPEPAKTGSEVKVPVELPSLGVIPPKAPIVEKESKEPVQLPSLGVNPPEPVKTGPEVKAPVELPSLGTMAPKSTVPEKQPIGPVKLPLSEK